MVWSMVVVSGALLLCSCLPSPGGRSCSTKRPPTPHYHTQHPHRPPCQTPTHYKPRVEHKARRRHRAMAGGPVGGSWGRPLDGGNALGVVSSSQASSSSSTAPWGTRTISNFNRTETIGEGTYGYVLGSVGIFRLWHLCLIVPRGLLTLPSSPAFHSLPSIPCPRHTAASSVASTR